MAKWERVAFSVTAGMIMPVLSRAQGLEGTANSIKGLHGVLDQLYEEMMPLCSQLIGVGSGLAGFAALWYISSRVWKHLNNAEPIDFYPLFRPFVIGFCVMNFTMVLGLINGVMKPTVTATAGMVEGSDKAIKALLKQKEEALKKTDRWQMYMGSTGEGNRDKWYKYTYDESPDKEAWYAGIGNDVRFAMEKFGYNVRNSVKELLSEVLRILFEAAALCINTLRTFQLIVLAILGPLVFGLAVFDGFQHTLTVWLARYINIFLWLPVANIFGAIIGKIQEQMIKLDMNQINENGYTSLFSATDTGYLIFMIIGIVGYFTVPSVANYIVHAASGGALPYRASSVFNSMAGSTAAMGGAIAGGVADGLFNGATMGADALGNEASRMWQSMGGHGVSSGYFGDKGDSSFMGDKLKGNS